MLALAIINTMIAPTNLKKDFTKEQGRQIEINREKLLRDPEIMKLHESIIGLIYEKASKKSSEELGSLQAPKEAIFKQFEATILKYAVQNLEIMVQKITAKEYAKKLDSENRFALCVNFTRILGLADDLY